MCCAKLNATDILTALNEETEIDDFSGDDSDFDTTWQLLPKRNAWLYHVCIQIPF